MKDVKIKRVVELLSDEVTTDDAMMEYINQTLESLETTDDVMGFAAAVKEWINSSDEEDDEYNRILAVGFMAYIIGTKMILLSDDDKATS